MCLLIALPNQAVGQHCTVAANRMNVIYMGIDNTIDVTVEKSSCADVVVTTENGSVGASSDRPCEFNWQPGQIESKAILHVGLRTPKGVRQIGDFPFRVKSLPNPTATLLNSSSGTVSKRMLCAARGPVANILNSDICAHIKIIHALVYVTRNSEIIFSREMRDRAGVRFDQETSVFFHSLINNDVVWLTDMQIDNRLFNCRTLNEIKLTVLN